MLDDEKMSSGLHFVLYRMVELWDALWQKKKTKKKKKRALLFPESVLHVL